MKRTDGNERDWEATATAEERTLARALEACELPAMPEGTVEAIRRRVRAEEMASRMRMRRVLLALAASVVLVAGLWGLRRGGDGTELAEAAAEADFFAEAEAEWISPYKEQFEELETTLLAFEALDFGSDATAFPNL